MNKKQTNFNSWDSEIQEDATLAELDATVVDKYKNLVDPKSEGEEPTTEQILEKLNLVSARGITKAALVMYAIDPAKFDLAININIESSNNSAKKLETRNVSGNLQNAFYETLELLENQFLKYHKSKKGVRTLKIPEYPKAALHEILLNALIHKDYLSNKPIKIKLLPDQMYVWNPGKLLPQFQFEKFANHKSFRTRNQLIAKVCLETKMYEDRGSGIAKIFSECSKNKLCYPEYSETKSGFKAMLIQKGSPQKILHIASSRNYIKPPLSIDEQIERIRQKGIKISNDKFTRNFLATVGYTRIKPYRNLFRDDKRYKYSANLTFRELVKMYRFDEKLKVILLIPLAQIEIFTRTTVSHILANLIINDIKDAYIHENEEIFVKFNKYEYRVLNKLHSIAKREANKDIPDPFIDYYSKKYDNFPSLPIWLAKENMTFDMLSKMVSHLNNNYSDLIANKLNIPDIGNNGTILSSRLHAFVVLRNICAHYTPLFTNRKISVKMKLPTINRTISENVSIGSLIYGIEEFMSVMPDSDDFYKNWIPKFVSQLDSFAKLNINSKTNFDLYNHLGLDRNRLITKIN